MIYWAIIQIIHLNRPPSFTLENLNTKDVFRSSQQLGARRAIDGNINQIPSQGSCFSSNNEIFPWWTVDIGFETKMYGVVLIARADCCRKYYNTLNIYFDALYATIFIYLAYIHSSSILPMVDQILSFSDIKSLML